MADKKGQKKRFCLDEEKASICAQTYAPGVSVARRYAMNTNLIHKCLRYPKFAPVPKIIEGEVAETRYFLPVEIVEGTQTKDPASTTDTKSTQSAIEIDISGGHQLRIVGGYDPEAPARLIRGLSV